MVNGYVYIYSRPEENGANTERASRPQSNASGGPTRVSPTLSSKDNPAADLRNMRRIIAEDPEWSLATVPLLWELCINHIVDNFESKFKL